MTLLITLASESVVHQSSDYRISDWLTGDIVETLNGTKHLEVGGKNWTARLAFTGIAFDRTTGYCTLDWIQDEAVRLSSDDGCNALVSRLAARGTEELRRVTADHRHLSLLVTVAEGGRCRLFLVSNFEAPRQNPRPVPMDALQMSDVDLSKLEVLVNGTPGALPRSEKKCLERMFRENRESSVVRDRMAAANRAAAMRPDYCKAISEGCWAITVFADGSGQGYNYGQVPGIPGHTFPSFDVGEYLKRTLVPARGKQITLVQSAFSSGPGVPLPPPTGAPREITFSCPTAMLKGVGQKPAAEYPRLTFEGRHGVVKARKNEQVSATLGTVILEVDPHGTGAGTVERQRFSNIPTVGGGQPRSWDYSFDLHGAVGAYTLQIAKMSVALRAAHCTGLSVVGPGEELVFVAPVESLVLHATPADHCATAEVVASFMIRDFPELLSV